MCCVWMSVSIWGKYARGLGVKALRLLPRHRDVAKGSMGAASQKLTNGTSSLDASTYKPMRNVRLPQNHMQM